MLSILMLSAGTASPRKQTSGGLAARVEQLASELNDVKAMMLDAERMTVRQPLEAHKSPLLAITRLLQAPLLGHSQHSRVRAVQTNAATKYLYDPVAEGGLGCLCSMKGELFCPKFEDAVDKLYPDAEEDLERRAKTKVKCR